MRRVDSGISLARAVLKETHGPNPRSGAVRRLSVQLVERAVAARRLHKAAVAERDVARARLAEAESLVKVLTGENAVLSAHVTLLQDDLAREQGNYKALLASTAPVLPPLKVLPLPAVYSPTAAYAYEQSFGSPFYAANSPVYNPGSPRYTVPCEPEVGTEPGEPKSL